MVGSIHVEGLEIGYCSSLQVYQPGGFPHFWLEAWEMSSEGNSILGLFLYNAVISKKLSFLSGMQRILRILRTSGPGKLSIIPRILLRITLAAFFSARILSEMLAWEDCSF